jgi:hypothetical protein
MSQEARAARKQNFELPTAEQMREAQKLEAEREQRRASRHGREQHRQGMQMQRAGIASNILLQLSPAFAANQNLIVQTRQYLETYFDRVFSELGAEPEPDDDAGLDEEAPLA